MKYFIRCKLYEYSGWVRDDLDYLSGMMGIPKDEVAQIIDACKEKCDQSVELLKEQMKPSDILTGKFAKIVLIGDSPTSEREGYFNIIKAFILWHRSMCYSK